MLPFDEEQQSLNKSPLDRGGPQRLSGRRSTWPATAS
jgi:hypothetical protein